MMQYSTIAVTCIKHDTVFRANEAQSVKQNIFGRGRKKKYLYQKFPATPTILTSQDMYTSYPRVGQGGSGLPIQFVPTTVGGFCLHNMTRERLFLC